MCLCWCGLWSESVRKVLPQQQLEHTQPKVTLGCKQCLQPSLSEGSQITGADRCLCWCPACRVCLGVEQQVGNLRGGWPACDFSTNNSSSLLRSSLLHNLVQKYKHLLFFKVGWLLLMLWLQSRLAAPCSCTAEIYSASQSCSNKASSLGQTGICV